MYTPLYIKTDNSLQSSLIKINDLIEYAKNNNIKSLTITDNTMYGVMDFYKMCITNNIKPIIPTITKTTGIEYRVKNPTEKPLINRLGAMEIFRQEIKNPTQEIISIVISTALYNCNTFTEDNI